MTTTTLLLPAAGPADRPSPPVPDDTIERCYWCSRPGCQWCPVNRCPDPGNSQCACPACAADLIEQPWVVLA
ncbi:hypothetical protein [Micromonospora sp. B9E7]|uniref:hypothetical protein n=1 Tax=Micromonospora sp. B9E7 TaxID=3153574 RepID=UPI00325D999E